MVFTVQTLHPEQHSLSGPWGLIRALEIHDLTYSSEELTFIRSAKARPCNTHTWDDLRRIVFSSLCTHRRPIQVSIIMKVDGWKG